jgi:hypothetical protein
MRSRDRRWIASFLAMTRQGHNHTPRNWEERSDVAIHVLA